MYGMVPKLCNQCKTSYTPNAKYKNCVACQQAINEKEEARPPCKSKGCKNKAKDPTDYCGKHELLHWKDSVETTGKKVCANYLRGCKEELEQDYTKRKCRSCLDKDMEAEKKRTEEKKATLPPVEESTGCKLCNSCLKYSPPDHFIGEKDNNTPVVRCKTCREQGKKADQQRRKKIFNRLYILIL
jgi:hypothetical protein